MLARRPKQRITKYELKRRKIFPHGSGGWTSATKGSGRAGSPTPRSSSVCRQTAAPARVRPPRSLRTHAPAVSPSPYRDPVVLSDLGSTPLTPVNLHQLLKGSSPRTLTSGGGGFNIWILRESNSVRNSD